MNIAELKAALVYGSSKGGRSLLFTEGKDYAVWERIRKEDEYSRLREELTSAAERYRGRPVEEIPYSLYKIFENTGSRKEYETAYFSRRGRLDTFAAMVLLYGQAKDIEALEDVIWAICNEYTWCLPAHLGGKSLQVPSCCRIPDEDTGVIVAVQEHSRVVDLFSSETAFALAEILYLIGERLSPLVVYRARKEILARVLQPYCSVDCAFGWETVTNNWAAVCAGSVGAAALYLIEDDEKLLPVLYRLLGTMDAFLSGYGPDGACTEGMGYWEYGFGFYVCFASLLRQRTGGKIDLMQGEKLKNMAMFPQKCYLAGNSIASFSDSGSTFKHHPGLFHFLKSNFSEVEIPESRFACGLYDDHCYRWCHFVRDFVWNGGKSVQPNKESTYFLEDAQWMISRKSSAGMDVGFAAKGGNNNESHNHNDLGSFVLNVNGDSLLTDLGGGEYTRKYFSAERYSILCNSSQGHSVPIIEGHDQKAGAECKALVLEAIEEKSYLKLDLTQAYGDPNLVKAVRAFSFEKKETVQLTLTDTFDFKTTGSGVTERFISLQEPCEVTPGFIRLSGEHGQVEIHYDPSGARFHYDRAVHVKHEAKPVDVYKLDFDFTGEAKEVYAQFVITAFPA